MTVFGHSLIIESLEANLPKNTLLVGPRSVGKKTIFKHLVKQHNLREVYYFSVLTNDILEDIKHLSFGSMSGKRVIFFRLGYPTTLMVEKLLKIVEDAPEDIHFFVTAVSTPMYTLTSRFVKYDLGYLDNADVANVLVSQGYNPKRAVELANKGFGVINRTVDSVKLGAIVAVVGNVLKAIEERNLSAIQEQQSKWDVEHTDAIITWAIEKLTGNFRLFDVEKHDILDKKTALAVLTQVDPFDRPRYVLKNTIINICLERLR